ncbi:hypothetical protein DFP72DRAFT_903612 [Ephemerocybe angulata]|uniref:FAD-binding domain-containing protein n=1 Tax=Ephemerocybe angulata TaxID=980116 RepID=A0A8H6HU04_9AGAR|nr:hypothetical protein DFP72DRAFT_903612 [Tulosesus angulatus]
MEKQGPAPGYGTTPSLCSLHRRTSLNHPLVVRSPPNMTQILNQWGFGPALAKLSHKCTTFSFRNGCTGDYLGSMKMSESFQNHVLADFLLLRNRDLHSLLFNAASEAGVEFLYDAEVVDVDSENVSVTLKGGQTLQADVIVAADGYDSTVRPLVMEEDSSEESGESIHYFNFEIPADIIQADEDLVSLVRPSEWSIWFGDEHAMHISFLAGAKDCAVTVQHKAGESLKDEDIQVPRLLDELVAKNKFEPRLRKLLVVATKHLTKFTIFRPHPAVESMTCEQARIVLVGSAGHPLQPTTHHGTALSIEDAQTLGLLFSHIRHRDQIPQLLNAFEEIRQPRIALAQRLETQRRGMLFAPPGPLMARRDAVLKIAMQYEDWEHMDEESFKLVWGKEFELSCHDATEKVEDWWTQWGAFFEKKDTGRRKSVVQVSTSVSRDGANPRMVHA